MNFESVEQARQMAFEAMQSDDQADNLELLSQTLAQFPHDGTLLYFYASELAEQQQFELALEQFSNAVFNEPQLHIARFQLALLASTMERGDLVEQHLPYLMELKNNHYLGYFSHALAAIFANDLDNAIVLLEGGIATNGENPALNHDMQQMLERIRQEQQLQSPVDEAKAKAEQVQADESEQAEQDSISTLTGSVLLDIYKNTH